jgi:integrase
MADNDLLAPDTAAAIERVPGVKQEGVRAGNWLLKEQASELLNAPNPATLKGKRDRAMLALLVGCGLRRAELLALTVNQIEQREGRWVILREMTFGVYRMPFRTRRTGGLPLCRRCSPKRRSGDSWTLSIIWLLRPSGAMRWRVA